MKGKVAKTENKKNVWKIISISMIIIFAMIIIGGAIKAHYIRSSFVKPNQYQIDTATKTAGKKLQSTGANPDLFSTQVSGKMRPMGDFSKSVIQVSFYNNATTHMFLVDVNSGEVLLHSQTDFYVHPPEKGMMSPRMGREEMWFPMGFFGMRDRR